MLQQDQFHLEDLRVLVVLPLLIHRAVQAVLQVLEVQLDLDLH